VTAKFVMAVRWLPLHRLKEIDIRRLYQKM